VSITFDNFTPTADNGVESYGMLIYVGLTSPMPARVKEACMNDDRNSDTKAELTLVDIPVDEENRVFASCVPASLDQFMTRTIYCLVLARKKLDADAIVDLAKIRNIATAELADDYIPAVAHLIGEMWCEDYVGFAHVTIGLSRLQGLLRHLGPEWVADLVDPTTSQSILLISPDKAQHTLGAVLLAGQLRRLGFSVRLALNPTRDEISELFDRMSFNATFISASQSERLENLRGMIDFLRTQTTAGLPIIVGGGLLKVHDDIAAAVGADLATSDIDEAIEHCDLTRTDINSARSTVRM